MPSFTNKRNILENWSFLHDVIIMFSYHYTKYVICIMALGRCIKSIHCFYYISISKHVQSDGWIMRWWTHKKLILEKGHDILLGLRDISHGTLSTLKAYGLELPTMHFTEGPKQKKILQYEIAGYNCLKRAILPSPSRALIHKAIIFCL